MFLWLLKCIAIEIKDNIVSCQAYSRKKTLAKGTKSLVELSFISRLGIKTYIFLKLQVCRILHYQGTILEVSLG